MNAIITILLLAMASQSPVVSPDGKRIAFLADKDLFIISADGTDSVRLTHTPEEESRAQWSRDGKEIRFSVFANNASRIYAVDVKTKRVREIGSVPGRAAGVSPDGKRTLYWTGGWTAVKMFNAALDGSDAHALTDGSGVMWCSQWSPDGKRIAYTGKDSAGDLQVYAMAADGSNVQQLTHNPGAQCPAWPPDGQRIAFQGGGYIGTTDTPRLGGAHEEKIHDELPFWFPDGKRIAFQSNRTGQMQIWVMNADGTGSRQVTK